MPSHKKIIKIAKNIIYTFDQFGAQISLQIEKKEKHNTLIGSLFSIAILTFVSFTCIQLFSDMLSQKDPNVVQVIEYTSDP